MTTIPKRRLFAPKILQTSPADCGAAALASVLRGFDVPVSYERLRQAFQGKVDGTSIDGIEELALKLGLCAEQVTLPPEHLLLPQARALPALVLVRQPDAGLVHFAVAWRAWGPLVQVMDPASGRRWLTRQNFLDEVYIHEFPVPAASWRQWAGSDEFCAPLRQRLASLKIDAQVAARVMNAALDDPGWRSLAALDAVVRMLECIARAGGLGRGKEAQMGLERFFDQVREDNSTGADQAALVPACHWFAWPTEDAERIVLRGAALLRIQGRQQELTPLAQSMRETRSQEFASTIARLRSQNEPEREIWRLLRADGLLFPAVVATALLLAAIGVTTEALLFQGVMTLVQELEAAGQRAQFLGGVIALAGALLVIQVFMAASSGYFGSQIEVRSRIAFLEKIPRLSAHYFDKLRTSDLVGQSYALRRLYDLPDLAGRFLQPAFQMALTAIGIVWIHPPSLPLVIAAAVFSIGAQFVIAPILVRRYTRVVTHLASLSRFYLDSLLGLVPVQAHGAERAIRREHENSLVDWTLASREYHRASTLAQAVVSLVNTTLAVGILFEYVALGGNVNNVLLLLYWTLELPVLGTRLTIPLRQYPRHRYALTWLLGLGRNSQEALEHTPPPAPGPRTTPLAVSMQNVTVRLGAQNILHDVNLDLAAGEHVAIVGPSGAGKSSLVGILLGWYQPTTGQVWVDGEILAAGRVPALRREIAWVDPAVQLWNRSLLYNLRYGAHDAQAQVSQAIERSDLLDVLARLPQGMQTRLGEGGGLISGGEGQRVRLARAMLRPGARLAILDEPFRGLDRAKRRQLLSNARQHWRDATLICITHDVGDTQDFGRVLVVEKGRIVEDDAPSRLLAQPNSRYRALLEAEREVRRGLWTGADWQRLWLQDKRLSQKKDAH